MERWVDRVAIVTGANSGLGKAIVVGLLENGMKVVGIARREDLLAVRDILININNTYRCTLFMSLKRDRLRFFPLEIKKRGTRRISRPVLL